MPTADGELVSPERWAATPSNTGSSFSRVSIGRKWRGANCLQPGRQLDPKTVSESFSPRRRRRPAMKSSTPTPPPRVRSTPIFLGLEQRPTAAPSPPRRASFGTISQAHSIRQPVPRTTLKPPSDCQALGGTQLRHFPKLVVFDALAHPFIANSLKSGFQDQ